jgi:hypothetical protein
MVNTNAFIEALTDRVDKIITTYYEEAPSKDAKYPYAVVNGINIITLEESGDMTSFYIDLWGDEKDPTTTEQLEGICDTLRNELEGEVVYVAGKFGAHLGFENQNS